MQSLYLNFHGIGVSLQSDWDSVLDDAKHDFAYFVSKRPQTVHLYVRVVADARPAEHWRRWLKTPRSGLYLAPPNERRICFFEKAWVRYQYENGLADIFCEDATVSFETLYMVVLSFVGESLDRLGLHRIHGFGFGRDGVGGILMAASGTGKSTLAMQLLEAKGVQILSDDTPLVNHNTDMFPFPQRIALKEKPKVGPQFIRKFTRVNYGEKYVVGSEYFKEAIPKHLPVQWLLVAKKGKGGQVKEVSRWRMGWALFKWLVIGYETPQIWELYLRPSWRDVKVKAGILVSRVQVAFRLFKSCRFASWRLGGAVEESKTHFISFFSQRDRVSA